MEKKRFAFVVRIWDENTAVTSEDNLVELRGSIQSIDSDKVTYFRALEEIPQLLQQIIEKGKKSE